MPPPHEHPLRAHLPDDLAAGAEAARATEIDVDTCDAPTRGVSTGAPRSIAVIGAGIAGLSAARALDDAGHDVVVLDKARGVGGRTSLRRGAQAHFDHGAQYFTARDPRFRRFVDAWVAEGVVAPFEARFGVVDADGRLAPGGAGDATRFVGVPGMNAVAKRMAEGLEVIVGARVTELARDRGAWTLSMADGRRAGGFDLVLVTAPAPQAAALVAEHSEPLARVARTVRMDPCWAAMVGFAEPIDAPFEGIFVNAGPLSWACRNAAKPGRPGGDAWVLHATPAWTRAHLEAGREEVPLHLTEALREALGVAGLPLVTESDAHRWMYSLAAPAREDGALLDTTAGLGLAGDWLAGSKVQGAFLSGIAVADHALTALGSPPRSTETPKNDP